MKKQIMSASAIALMALATSCSKNEPMPGNSGNETSNVEQISFRSSTGKTRANDFGLTALESGFNVVGLKKDGSYITGFANPTGDVETYWKTGGAWTWKTAPTGEDKKWPTEDAAYPLTFFMAYPKTDVITKDAQSAALVATPNMTPDANFAFNTYYEKNAIALDAAKVSVDELGAKTEVAIKPSNGFANLMFKHIMSNILFDVKVPADVKAVIHSIKIANMNKSGRSYDYNAQTWGTETYTDANHAHYAHFVAPAATDAQNITSAASAVNGFTDGAGGYNTLKLMPQTNTDKWALGVDENEVNSFRKDARAWHTVHSADLVAGIEAWHMSETVANGMKDSEGWRGARIEVIYCLVDTKTGKNLVGRLKDVDGAAKTQYVRVGYPLDLATLETKAEIVGEGAAPAVMGLAAGYKYKFIISLGTADATNGVLLDPDYKDENGGSTDDKVDNPKTNPGDVISKGGVINFNVDIEEWADYTGGIK